MAVVTYKTRFMNDKNLLNATVTTFSDGIHDTLFSASVETFTEIFNIFVDFEGRLPESSDDNNYEKLYFRTKINGMKFLKGVRGNYLIALLVDMILKSLDFEFKFPLKKVRK